MGLAMWHRWAIAMIFCTAVEFFDASAQVISDDTILSIDIGRIVAMLDQVSTLMKFPDMDQPPSQNPAEMLDFAVARYEVLRKLACERTIIEGQECATPYLAALQPNPVPLSVLRREVTDVQNRILPFWREVCSELDNPQRRSCLIE